LNFSFFEVFLFVFVFLDDVGRLCGLVVIVVRLDESSFGNKLGPLGIPLLLLGEIFLAQPDASVFLGLDGVFLFLLFGLFGGL